MTSGEAIRAALISLASKGISAEPPVPDHPLIGFHMRSGRSFWMNEHGQRELDALVREIRSDRAVAAGVSADELWGELLNRIPAVADADDPFRTGDEQAESLCTWLRAGAIEWQVVVPVPGLTLPTDDSITLAGFKIGALTAEELTAIRAASVYAATSAASDQRMRAADQVSQEMTENILSSAACWGTGTVVSQEGSALWVAKERILLACDILRTFALPLGIDPDQSLLGQYRSTAQHNQIYFRENGAVTHQFSVADGRLAYDLILQQHLL